METTDTKGSSASETSQPPAPASRKVALYLGQQLVNESPDPKLWNWLLGFMDAGQPFDEGALPRKQPDEDEGDDEEVDDEEPDAAAPRPSQARVRPKKRAARGTAVSGTGNGIEPTLADHQAVAGACKIPWPKYQDAFGPKTTSPYFALDGATYSDYRKVVPNRGSNSQAPSVVPATLLVLLASKVDGFHATSSLVNAILTKLNGSRDSKLARSMENCGRIRQDSRELHLKHSEINGAHGCLHLFAKVDKPAKKSGGT